MYYPQGDTVIESEVSGYASSSCAPVPDELETSSEETLLHDCNGELYCSTSSSKLDDLCKYDRYYAQSSFNTLNRVISGSLKYANLQVEKRIK